MSEKEITHEESLDIIQSMIQKTQVNVKQSSFHLLFWGWLIMLISLSHFILLNTQWLKHPEYVWLGVFPGIIVSFIYGFTQGKKSPVKTYASSVYMWLWMGFIISLFLTSIIIEASPNLISSLSLVFAGYATFMSGQILRFKPLIAGGILFWVGAMVSFALSNEYSLLVSAVSVLTGYIIPGHLLRNRVQDVTF